MEITDNLPDSLFILLLRLLRLILIFGMLLHTEERQSGFAMLESAYAGILVDSYFWAEDLSSEIRSSSFA